MTKPVPSRFTRRNRSVLTLATLWSAALMVAPQIALAQSTTEAPVSSGSASATSDKNTLGEIVVTAQRNRSTVQKTPLAVSAFDTTAMEAKQINNVLTLINNVPNFSGANNVTLPTAVSLFIRGIGATDSSVTADPPVGLYIDDVIVARQQLNNAGIFDLQRVEVLRGPQGTLYGRNTAAGAIKMISNPPTNTYEGWAEAGAGNYSYRFARGVVNIPLVEGKLFARANFVVTDRGGITDNLTTGQKVNDLETSSFRGALRYIVNDAIELNLKADTSRVNSQGVVGVDVAGMYVPATGDYFKVHSGDKPYNLGETQGVNAYADWKINDDLTLKSITGYRYTYQNYSFDFSDQPIPAYINASTAKTRQYTQEFQALGSIGKSTTFVGGLFLMREEARQIFGPQTFINYSRVGGVFPPQGTTNVPRDPAFIYSEDFRLNTNSYAAYLQGAYAITDPFKIEVGIRYTSDLKDYSVSAVQGPVGAPLPTLFTTANVVAATGQPPKKTWSQFTPHVGLNYQITPDLLTYASATRGFQSGNFFGRVRAPAGLIAYNPTIVTSYETGFKSTFLGGRARFNATGFYTEQKDLPVSYASVTQPGTFAVASLSPTVWGLELEGALRVTDGLTFNGSLGWLNYKYKNFSAIPTPVRASLGPRLRFSPHVTSKIGVDYRTDLPSNWGLRFSNNYAYTSEQYTNTGNTKAGFAKARTLVDAAVSLEAPNGKYVVSLSCANCSNEKYIGNSLDFGGVNGGGLPVSLVFPGDPRMWQVSLRVNF